MRGGRKWHGGIGMINDEKDGMVEKACIQTSRSPPPVTVVSSPCFPVNTENCDSCAVGEDGMEELV